jgi:hypothetical protein
MEFIIPSRAPSFRVAQGRTVRLLPLTVMRKKTLVNFGIHDNPDNTLSLLSMRNNQALTQQIVLALADLTPGVECTPELVEFARLVAAGTQEELLSAFRKADAGALGDDVSALLKDAGSGRLVRRLASNFLLLPPIDDDGPSQRVVHFWYDEPLSLTYKKSGYNPVTRSYEHAQRPLRIWEPPRLAAAIGWSPTVVRFPTAAAENTQSYHFEVAAPPGLVIASASIVAGRPNEPVPPSWDHVEGGHPVVNLHVVEVPNGSMSRTQVSLRLNRRGWLVTTALASALSSILLWAAFLRPVQGAQGQPVAAALLAVTAAVTVFIVRPDEHQMASRQVNTVRAAATVSICLLVGVGILITFLDHSVSTLTGTAAVIGTLCTLLVLIAWIRARPSRTQISPWEQGLLHLEDEPSTVTFDTLERARQQFGFDQPAIKVGSSEGDHQEEFNWTDPIEAELNRRLENWPAANLGPTGSVHERRPTPPRASG